MVLTLDFWVISKKYLDIFISHFFQKLHLNPSILYQFAAVGWQIRLISLSFLRRTSWPKQTTLAWCFGARPHWKTHASSRSSQTSANCSNNSRSRLETTKSGPELSGPTARYNVDQCESFQFHWCFLWHRNNRCVKKGGKTGCSGRSSLFSP